MKNQNKTSVLFEGSILMEYFQKTLEFLLKASLVLGIFSIVSIIVIIVLLIKIF